ncbi:MAG: hypothetical protein AAGH64_09300 [Planctomycetota bacterium]
MITRTVFACAVAALATNATASHSSDQRDTRFEIVDFSDQYNIRADRNSMPKGGFFNARTMPNDAQKTREGIPFSFGPSHGPYAWNAVFAEGGSVRTLDIDTDLEGAVRVYTMINTFWGTTDAGQLAIEFLGSDGAFHREELRGNVNVRDYNHNRHATNRTTASNVREVFDNHHGQRIDMQTWTLPADFADETLAKIRVVDTGTDQRSRAMVWAITAEVLDPAAARAEAFALIDTIRTERAQARTHHTSARALIERARAERAQRRTLNTPVTVRLVSPASAINPGGVTVSETEDSITYSYTIGLSEVPTTRVFTQADEPLAAAAHADRDGFTYSYAITVNEAPTVRIVRKADTPSITDLIEGERERRKNKRR